MFVARSKLADGIELLKQNYSELLVTVQDLTADWVRSYDPPGGGLWYWRIGRHKRNLQRAIDLALPEVACLAEPKPGAHGRAPYIGYRWPCLENTQTCWRAFRRVQRALNRFPDHPGLRAVKDAVNNAVDRFDVSRPVDVSEWPTSEHLIADYMGFTELAKVQH
jgi:hypothetical protein